jgi:gas vesicle protein
MATRTDEPLTVHGGLEGDEARKAEKIREDIAETRNHMARTVDAIEERLSPKNIKAQVSSVKSHLLDEVSSTKTKLLEEIKDVKSTVKSEVTHELGAAKAKVREQTIGRVENMVHGARDITMQAGSTTLDTVKTNPIPAALVAVGLGWLIVSSMKSKKATTTYDSRIRARSFDGVDEDGYEYSYDQGVAQANADAYGGPRRVIKRGRRAVSNAVSNVGGSVSHAASNVGDTVSSVGQDLAGKASNVASNAKSAAFGAAHTVADKAEHLAHDASTLAHDASQRVGGAAVQAKRKVGVVARNAGMKGRRVVRNAGTQVRRAEQGFERELRANPLAFGAVAVAVGAAIGLLLPATEVEDRLVGEKKDLLLDTAKERFGDIAQQAISTVQEKAGEVTSNLKNGGPDTKPQGYQNGVSRSNGLSNGYSNGLSKHV